MAKISAKHVGTRTGWGVNEIEKGAIRRFCAAIGETGPVHLDEAAARAAGFRSIVAPPTFATCLQPATDVRDGVGLEYKNMLHSEQEYEYFRPIVAGDTISVRSKITDLFERKGAGGIMQFLVIEDEAKDARDRPVYHAKQTIVVFVK